MKCDAAWLRNIQATRLMVQRLGPLIAEIPDISERQIVRHQYQVLHDRFRADVHAGDDPSGASGELWYLWDLTADLTVETGE